MPSDIHRSSPNVSQSDSGISIMRNSIVLKGLLAAAAAAVPLLCNAESNVQTGANTAAPGATAHVDFQITIPKILYLRVGTGSSYTTGVLTSVGTVDLIQFAPAAAVVGNGTAVAGTGGDQANGVETAAVVSNSGNVTLNATATVVITAPPTKVIIQDAKWTYAYANTTTPPAGIYGGVNVNNGRVVYTATMP